MTSLRSFLMFYLPLLEPDMNTEADDDDFLQDSQEHRRVDLVVPFKKSVKQIVREVNFIDLHHSQFHDNIYRCQIAFMPKFRSICLLSVIYKQCPLELGDAVFIFYYTKTYYDNIGFLGLREKKIHFI